MPDDIDLKKRAKGIVDDLESSLDQLFPEHLGQTVLGVMLYVDRDSPIVQAVNLNPDSGEVSITGKVRYRTSDSAAINQAGLGIDFSADVETKYDVQQNELTKIKVSFDLPKHWGSVDADLTTIKKILDGDLSAALELIPNFGVVKRKTSSEYDAQKKWYQDKYGAKNVYFASSDFVRWASPETAGRWVVQLILSGGSAAAAIAQEARQEVVKELAHIIKWLEQQAVASATSIAEDFVQGKPIAIPELKLMWQRVTYKSQVVIGGRELPEIDVEHGAFVLVWKSNSITSVDVNPTPTTVTEDNDPRPKWKIGARYVIGPTGCRVIFTQPGGPADKAGLQIDDVITQAAGVAVGDAGGRDRLIQQIKDTDSQSLSLEVLSGNQSKLLTVILDPVL